MKHRQEEDLNPQIFGFNRRTIDNYILHTLNIKAKFKKSFAYVYDKLVIEQKGAYVIKPKMDLGKIQWSEGKNYNWLALTDNKKKPLVQILIRHYANHFTIFFKYKYKITDNSELDDYFYTRQGVFTFETKLDNMTGDEHDSYIEDRFKDINKYLYKILELMREDKIGFAWNPYSLKLDKDVQRPKHVVAKTIWEGDDTVESIDLLIFAVEELFEKHLEIFATTDMLEKIKTMKVGDKVGNYEVLDIKTEVKNDYYHAVGLNLNGSIGSSNKESFVDVYSLTRYYYEGVFNIPEQA